MTAFHCNAGEFDSEYIDRLCDALSLLCGGERPVRARVERWLVFDDSCTPDLQTWVLGACKLPWAMGITVIEAAMLIAEKPREDGKHRPRPKDLGGVDPCAEANYMIKNWTTSP